MSSGSLNSFIMLHYGQRIVSERMYLWADFIDTRFVNAGVGLNPTIFYLHPPFLVLAIE